MRPLAALELATGALAAAMAAGAIKGHVPGDVPEDHEDNTFGLPEGSPLRKKLRRYFRDQLQRIVGFVGRIGTQIPDRFPRMTDYNDAMASAMTPLLSVYWDKTGRGLRGRLGLDPDEWRVTDPHLHRMVAAQAFQFCAATNATTDLQLGDALAQLRDQFHQGLVERGETGAQLAKRVQAVFTRASQSRAVTIARTEAARAVHAASIESARSSGVVAGKRWLVSAHSCPLCHRLAEAANSLPLDGEFGQVGNNPDYRSVRYPPAHPNCRCSITYVLSDDEAAAPVAAFVPPAASGHQAAEPEGAPPQFAQWKARNERATEAARADRDRFKQEHDQAGEALAQAAEALRLGRRQQVDGPTDARLNFARDDARQRLAAAKLALKPAEDRLRRLESWESDRLKIPNLVPPLPIADRLSLYIEGDRKVAAIAKLAGGLDDYEARHAELDAIYRRLDQETDRTDLDPEARREAQAARGEAIQKLNELAKLHKAQSRDRDQVHRDLARLLQVDRPAAIDYAGHHPDQVPSSPANRATSEGVAGWLRGKFARGDDAAISIPIGDCKPNDVQRAFYNSRKGITCSVVEKPAIVVHETGHALDDLARLGGSRAGLVSKEFVEYRVGDEKPTRMLDVDPTRGFGPEEVGRKDHFDRVFDRVKAYYAGRLYPGETDSEILAMGLEELYRDPVNFAKKDPEYCKFVLGMLDGSLR